MSARKETSSRFSFARRSRPGSMEFLREQLCTGLGELHIGAGLVLPQPAFSNGVVQGGTVLSGRAAFLEQEGPVDLLDVDAAVMHSLGCVGDLQQLAGGDGRIGERSGRDVLHGSKLLHAVTVADASSSESACTALAASACRSSRLHPNGTIRPRFFSGSSAHRT